MMLSRHARTADIINYQDDSVLGLDLITAGHLNWLSSFDLIVSPPSMRTKRDPHPRNPSGNPPGVL